MVCACVVCVCVRAHVCVCVCMRVRTSLHACRTDGGSHTWWSGALCAGVTVWLRAGILLGCPRSVTVIVVGAFSPAHNIHITYISVFFYRHNPSVSQARLKPSPRLKCNYMSFFN